MLVPMGKPAARLVWHLVLALLSWLGVQERTTSLRRRLRIWLLRSWWVTRVCRVQMHLWVRQYNVGGALRLRLLRCCSIFSLKGRAITSSRSTCCSRSQVVRQQKPT